MGTSQEQSLENYARNIFHKCEEAFGHNSTNQQRQDASMFLQNVGESDARFLFILEKVFSSTDKPEVLILFSNLGLKTITKFWGSLEADFLLNFRDFIIQFLRQTNINLMSVINIVSRLPCRITKLGWLSDNRYKDFTASIASFLSNDVGTCNKGLLVLSVFIDEINLQTDTIITTKQRKIATDFRDRELLNIFNLSIEVMKRILTDTNFMPSRMNDNSFIENALSLCYKCLNFDFIGTNTDESSSEFGSLQVPSKWARSFKPQSGNDEDHVIKVVWKILILIAKSDINDDMFKSNAITKCLQLINSLAMIRKSLFSLENNKVAYFSYICHGTLEILKNYSGILNDIKIFNSFCRVILSLKNNCQINILLKMGNYEHWIEAIADFTKTAFNLQSTSSNGIHFLLELWSNFSSSITYFRGKTPSFLKNFIPDITLEFLESKNNHLIAQMKEGEHFDNMLNELEMTSIYQFLPQLFLFDYEKSVTWIKNKFDVYYERLMLVINGSVVPDANSNKSLQLLEVEVSWILYVVATVVAGNLPIGVSKEKYKILDATLCSIVFKIVPYSSFRAKLQIQNGIEATPLIERGILSFFANFHRSYIQLYISRSHIMGEITEQSSDNFFSIIGQEIGKTIDRTIMMDVIITKLLENLIFWHTNKKIVDATLDSLQILTHGYESFKVASKSQIIDSIIKNHFKDFQNFLCHPLNSKQRTLFYRIFTKYVLNDEELKDLPLFLSSFDKVFEMIESRSNFNDPEVVRATISLCRDLTGVCRACFKKSTYERFFDWFHNNHFSSFLLLFEGLSVTPEAAVPMLRFLEEFVANRGSRVLFDVSSPDGLNLFKSTQKALSTYGTRLNNLKPETMAKNDNELYTIKIKGITITVSIFNKILVGGYIPFGALRFYGDNSFRDLVMGITNLVLSIPLSTIYGYKKLSSNFYEMIEHLFNSHLSIVSEFPPEMFSTIIKALNDGIQSTNLQHSIKAAAAIDYICLFICKTRKKHKKSEYYETICKRMTDHIDVLLKLTSVLFQFILFDNVSNQFTLTRTLFSLVVFNPKLLEYYAEVLLRAQPREQVEEMKRLLFSLMQHITNGSITTKQREAFSRKMLTLKMHVANVQAVPVF